LRGSSDGDIMITSLIVGLIVLLIAATAFVGRCIQQDRRTTTIASNHLEEVCKRGQEKYQRPDKIQEEARNKCFLQEAEAIVNSYQRRKAIFRPVIESKDNEDS